MARDMNHVVISGRVVQEVDLRQTDDGKPVADFKIVSNRKHLQEGDPDRLKTATFVKVTIWGEDALYWSGQGHKKIEPLHRGDSVVVEGQLSSDDFIPKDSDKRTSGRIRIDSANITLMKRARHNNEATDE